MFLYSLRFFEKKQTPWSTLINVIAVKISPKGFVKETLPLTNKVQLTNESLFRTHTRWKNSLNG